MLGGQVALITGATSAIGEAIAFRFSESGASVVLADIDCDRVASLASRIGGERTKAVQVNVSSRSDIDEALDAAKQAFGVPTIVVNGAAISHPNQAAFRVDEADFDQVFAVNVKSIFHMVHSVVPAMIDNGGGVMINVGSSAGMRPRHGMAWYNSSMAAISMLSKSLAQELAPWNIRVNSLCPVMGGLDVTEASIGMPNTPENRWKILSTIPLGRFCDPQDVAQGALYLATADFVTGVELPIDGGRAIS